VDITSCRFSICRGVYNRQTFISKAYSALVNSIITPFYTETTRAAYYNRHKPVILDYPRIIAKSGRHIHKFKYLCTPLSEDDYCCGIPTGNKRTEYFKTLDGLRAGRKVSSKVRPFTKLYILVLRRQHILSSAAQNVTANLAPKFCGPVKIKRVFSPVVYELEGLDGIALGKVHVQDLKPYRFPNDA